MNVYTNSFNVFIEISSQDLLGIATGRSFLLNAYKMSMDIMLFHKKFKPVTATLANQLLEMGISVSPRNLDWIPKNIFNNVLIGLDDDNITNINAGVICKFDAVYESNEYIVHISLEDNHSEELIL